MTPRERFLAALERKPLTGRVPHFELVFFLTMETFGKVHPNHRRYSTDVWNQMQESERQLHRRDMARLYVDIAERFEHSAIYITARPAGSWDEAFRIVDAIREISGDTYALMLPGDSTYSLPDGEHMLEFTYRLADEPQAVKEEAQRRIDEMVSTAERCRDHGGIDGFINCCDYCYNTGPFLSPPMFAEFVGQYLRQLIAAERELGFYVIKHTDGNIMPILDQLVDANPHALHSIDPQAGVDIAEVNRLVGDRVALCGNVNCGALDTGSDEDVIASAREALRGGMPGGGYIFCTSNCIYTGMRLERYELMLDVWRKEGKYPDAEG